MKYIAIVVILCIILIFVYEKTSLLNSGKMKVAVWDTYVQKKDGAVMHFDIIAPAEITDSTIIYGYGRAYLTSKNQEDQPLTSKQCRFCHFEHIKPDMEESIKKLGYYILEMENCD